MAEDIGTLLLRAGLIDEAARQRAVARAQQSHTPLSDVLVDSGLISETALCTLLCAKLYIKEATAAQLMSVRADVLELVPADTALEHRVVPLQLDAEGNLTLAMADPTDAAAVDEIAFFTNKYVNRAAAPLSKMRAALDKYYGAANTVSAPAAAIGPAAHAAGLSTDTGFEPKEAAPAPVRTNRNARVRPATSPELRPRTGELRTTRRPPSLTDLSPTDSRPSIVLDRALVDRPAAAAVPLPQPETPTVPLRNPMRSSRDTLEDPRMTAGPIDEPMDSGTPMGSLVMLLQDLANARERDDVIRYMLGYLLTTHAKADFLLVRGAELQVWNSPPAHVVTLKKASIFSEVIATRVAFRGAVSAQQGRSLATAVNLDADDVQIVPVIIRDRVVGLFYASRPQADADEHTRVAARAAGQALERILVLKQVEAKGPYTT